MRRYVSYLKSFVEGEIPLLEWRAWLEEHSEEIENTLGRNHYLKLKYLPYYEVSYMLDELRVEHEVRRVYCEKCGSKLFHAVPGVTTAEETVSFARNSELKEADEIIRDAWIHPGTYCPNGCVLVMRNYGGR